MSVLKNKLFAILSVLLLAMGCIYPFCNTVESAAPVYNKDFASDLENDGWVLSPEKRFGVEKEKTLRENIVALFYPNTTKDGNAIYHIIRDITLGVMIIFIVLAGASLLLNKKPEESNKHLTSLLYILLGGVFIYAANRLFGSVLNFNYDKFTAGEGEGIGGFTSAFIGNGGVLFIILSAIKAFAFFLAIIMIVITGFKVMAAGEGEKGKKLLKGLKNVVVALLIIKGVDFIYYLAADSGSFVRNASDFIINIAKVFGYIYGVIIVIMVIVAGYLYITDGGNGSNFKKASNVLINILLSALVLFAFLLITYQIFAEFQTGGDALEEVTETGETTQESIEPTVFLIVNQNYT